MTYFVVDVEADGPVPHLYSMVSFGAVVLDEDLTRTFYGKVRPLSDRWVPEALAITGHSREETLLFPDASAVLPDFDQWVRANTQEDSCPVFVSDNNGFDFGFMSYYLWRFTGENVFGHISRNLNDLYRGLRRKMHCSPEALRRTVHDHNPVNDALGNAEALLAMREQGLDIVL